MLRASRPRGRHLRGRAGNKGLCAARAGPGAAAPRPACGAESRALQPPPRRCGAAARLGGAGSLCCLRLLRAPAVREPPRPDPAAAARSGCGRRHPPWLPVTSPCPRPGEGHLAGLPGGWEGAGSRAVLHAEGVSSASAVRIHTPPCQPRVCSGLMPPREKPLPSLCCRTSIYLPSQAGQALPFESTLNGFGEDLWNSLG